MPHVDPTRQSGDRADAKFQLPKANTPLEARFDYFADELGAKPVSSEDKRVKAALAQSNQVILHLLNKVRNDERKDQLLQLRLLDQRLEREGGVLLLYSMICSGKYLMLPSIARRDAPSGPQHECFQHPAFIVSAVQVKNKSTMVAPKAIFSSAAFQELLDHVGGVERYLASSLKTPCAIASDVPVASLLFDLGVREIKESLAQRGVKAQKTSYLLSDLTSVKVERSGSVAVLKIETTVDQYSMAETGPVYIGSTDEQHLIVARHLPGGDVELKHRG